MAPAVPPTGRSVRIGLIQAQAHDDPEANLATHMERVREAAADGAQIVCLQELFRSTYFCQEEDAARFDLAEPIPGPTTDAMCALAAELGIVLIVPVFEARAKGLYHNSAVVIDADGTLLGTYRKMHIPDDPGFHEKYYFAPGDLGFKVWDTAFGRIGVLICWDQWYPEAARLTTLQGADILFYPTAIGTNHVVEPDLYGPQHTAWQTVQRGHAVANGVYVAAVNRVGREDELEFWGRSFVCGPFGDIVAEAPANKEHILMADVDLDRIEAVRRGWPFLRDRRIDAYGPITKRFMD